MKIVDFKFADHATHFDAHVAASIPGYERLGWWCVKLSRRFVQGSTNVIDVGCSSGKLLRRVRDANHVSRLGVEYVGVDIESCFVPQWRSLLTNGLRFEACDALSYNFVNNSLVIASFTLQFIAERKKLALLQSIHDSLVDGGALLLAEKTVARSSTLQELITFVHYDHKRSAFTAEEILDKEQQLRGLMTPWTRARLFESLLAVGFQAHDIEAFWQEGPFIAVLAMKRVKPVHSAPHGEEFGYAQKLYTH
jgi:tRNA (cmo5U34)-methyltransferase